MKQNTKSPALFGMRGQHVTGYLLRVATLASLVLWLGSATAHAQDFGPVGSGYSSEDFARDPFTAAHNQTIAQNQTAPFKEMARKNQEADLLRQEGMNLEKKGQWREAVAKYKESLGVYTVYSDMTYAAIGSAYMSHGYSRIATDWYRKYTYSMPRVISTNCNTQPLFQYCLLLCNAGEWDEAATVYNAARAILGNNYYRDQIKLLPNTMDLPVANPALFKAYIHTALALQESDDKLRFAELATAQRLAPRDATVAFFGAMRGPDEFQMRKPGLLRAATMDRGGLVKSLVATELESPMYKASL